MKLLFSKSDGKYCVEFMWGTREVLARREALEATRLELAQKANALFNIKDEVRQLSDVHDELYTALAMGEQKLSDLQDSIAELKEEEQSLARHITKQREGTT